MTRKFSHIALGTLLTISLTGCAISVGNQNVHSGRNASATFGNIYVDSGQSAGDLRLSNGNVEIGDDATAGWVDVTNGNIQIGNGSRMGQLETVNGNIEAGKQVSVERDVITTNGNIEFEQDAILRANVETVNGNITLGEGSKVFGDIIFRSTNMLSSLSGKKPKLTLAEGVKVKGRILLYQPVRLDLPDSIKPEQVVRHFENGE